MIPQMGAARARVAGHAARFRAALAAAGLDTGGSTTQIVPLILGAEERALGMARALEAEGFLAVAIRPPTVPAGTSRIRFTFSAAHSEEQVAALSEAVVRLAQRL
jgi:8-amino-7-oxononanoate synthase